MYAKPLISGTQISSLALSRLPTPALAPGRAVGRGAGNGCTWQPGPAEAEAPPQPAAAAQPGHIWVPRCTSGCRGAHLPGQAGPRLSELDAAHASQPDGGARQRLSPRPRARRRDRGPVWVACARVGHPVSPQLLRLPLPRLLPSRSTHERDTGLLAWLRCVAELPVAPGSHPASLVMSPQAGPWQCPVGWVGVAAGSAPPSLARGGIFCPLGRYLTGAAVLYPHAQRVTAWRAAPKATKGDAVSSRLGPCLVTQQLQDTPWPRASPTAPCRTRRPCGTAASDNLPSPPLQRRWGGTGCGEPTPVPSILLRQDTRHGTPVVPAGDRCVHPTAARPSVSPRVSALASRHCHASPGTATHPWARPRIPGAATNTALATEEGTRASPSSAPEIPGRDRHPRHVPAWGGGVCARSPAQPPHPGHRGDGGAMPERDAAGQGAGAPSPPPRQPSQPHAHAGPVAGGQDPPAPPGTGAGLGLGWGSGAAPDPRHGRPGLGWGYHGPSRTQPHIPELVARRVPVKCPPPHRALARGCQEGFEVGRGGPCRAARPCLRARSPACPRQSPAGRAGAVGLAGSGGQAGERRGGRRCCVPSPSPGRVPGATGDESAASLPRPAASCFVVPRGTRAEHSKLVPPVIRSPAALPSPHPQELPHRVTTQVHA